MINLLPQEEKQKLFLAKKEKLAAIYGIIVLISLLCLTLVLLSIKFYILADTDYQKYALKQAKQLSENKALTDLNVVIEKYNGTLAQLDSFYKKEIYFNQALETITNIPVPKGLYLNNFSLDRNEDGSVKASVSGISDTRDHLLTFKKNIEDSAEIKDSYFSPESWISPKDISFSLTFEIYKNGKQQ